MPLIKNYGSYPGIESTPVTEFAIASLSEKQHRGRSRMSSWTRSKTDVHSQQIQSRYPTAVAGGSERSDLNTAPFDGKGIKIDAASIIIV